MRKFFFNRGGMGEKSEDFDPGVDCLGAEENLENENTLEAESEKYVAEIKTVRDFIDSLKWSYDEAKENDPTRAQLAHQIVKIEISLNVAGLSADNVKVSQLPNGTLGAYAPSENQIYASENMLSDFGSDTQLLRTVFVHENVHKKEKIVDEGLTQIRVRQKISATPGIYEGEQRKARRAFYETGLKDALDLYDLKNPSELVDYYIEVELEKEYKNKKEELKRLARPIYFNERVGEKKEKFARKFKEGAPRLYEKLSSRNYDFTSQVRKTIKKILEEKR